MIGILDYGAGNIKSVQNALDRIGVSYFVSDDPVKLATADKIIFPGVGHAESAMKILKNKKLDQFLCSTKMPVLGICLGMQLLFEFSEEGGTDCLKIISGKVLKFDQNLVSKIPNMGWSEVQAPQPPKGGPLNNNYCYFVHSYYVPVNDFTVSTANYNGQDFSAVVQFENFTGMQFHPEKSGDIGEKILQQFIMS